ncbi:MAG: hypothetical protein ACFNLE_05330, partial [Rothia aeria]
ERAQQLGHQPQGLLDRQGACRDEVAQRGALDVLHDEEIIFTTEQEDLRWKNLIQIGDRLAKGILSGAIHDGDTVEVDVNPDVAMDGLSVTSKR